MASNPPPVSSVAPLPAVQTSPTFTISWSGSDPGGPGVATYNVYVSDNGGAFTAVLTATTLTTTTFDGQPGHTYAFYSVATDQLGISQPTPSAAQATTTVQLPPAPPSPPSSPAGPPPAVSPPSGTPPAISAVDQLFASFEEIVTQVEAEIQQLITAELTLEQQVLNMLSALTRTAPRV